MRCPTAEIAMAAIVLAGSAAAEAQQPVYTYPVPATSAGGNVSGTIVSSGTFQQVFAAASMSPGAGARKACTVINQGTSTMYVTEGSAVADSSAANSVQLVAGQAFFCNAGGVVLSGQVNISGSAGEAFYAAQE